MALVSWHWSLGTGILALASWRVSGTGRVQYRPRRSYAICGICGNKRRTTHRRPGRRRQATMRHPRSIRFHLSAVFFFFFLLVVVLGLFSITRLSGFDKVALDIVDL